MEEIYTVISYHEEIRSAKVKKSGCGNFFRVPKCIKSTQYKTENNIESNTGIVLLLLLLFSFSISRGKQRLQSISRYRRKERADKFNVNNALVCEFHLNPSDVNMLIGKGK